MTPMKPASVGMVFENHLGTIRRRIEQLDGNHVIYATSEKVNDLWTSFEVQFFCCSTMSAMYVWGRHITND